MSDSKQKDRSSLSHLRSRDSNVSKSISTLSSNNRHHGLKTSHNQKPTSSTNTSNSNSTTQSPSSNSSSTFSYASPTQTQTSLSTQAQIPIPTSISTAVSNSLQTQLKCLSIENSIISIIFDRITLLLPHKSGFPISQVLSDPYYIQAKSHLMKLSIAPEFTRDLIACIYNLIVRIKEEDPAQELSDKSVNILNSIYIIISLLSTFLNVIKSRETLKHSASTILQRGGLKTTHLLYKSAIPSTPTTNLDNDLSLKLLKLLLSLKNESTCLKTLYSITEPVNISSSNPFINPTSQASNLIFCSNLCLYYNNSFLATSVTQPTVPSSVQIVTSESGSNKTAASDSISTKMANSDLSTSQTSILKLPSITSNNNTKDNGINETNKHEKTSSSSSSSTEDYNEVKLLLSKSIRLKSYDIINLIDESISSVLFYIAATNPTQYLNFEKLIFRYINVDSLYVKGSHLIQFSYLSSDNFNANIQFIREVFHITKRDSQQSLLLHFFSESILTWALYRTEDFIKALDYPLCCKNSEVFFDILYKQLDSKYSPKVYYSILSCLLFFQPKQLIKFISEKSNKSTTQALKRSLTNVAKLSSNKQKFLSEFTQLITKSPEYAQPLILFLLVGSSIRSFDTTHPLYKFVEFMDEPLTRKLKIDNLENFKAFPDLNFSTKSSTPSTFDINNTNISTNSTTSSTTSTNSIPTDTSSNSNTSFTPNSNSIPTSLTSITSTNTNDHDMSLHQNSKISYELKVGVFAVSSVVNQSALLDKIITSLNVNKTSIQLLPLFTGSFRLLILLPSLSNVTVSFIEKLSSCFSKILSLLCDQITKNRKTVNLNLKPQLSSPLSRRNSLSHATIERTSSDASSYPSAINKQRLRSPAVTMNSTNSSIFKTSPLKLSHEDIISNTNNKLDTVSTRLTNTEEFDDLDNNVLPFFKLTTDSNDVINEPINYNLIKSQLPRCSYDLMKKNIINLLTIYSSYPFLLYPDVDSNGRHEPDFNLFQKIFKKFIDKVTNLLYLEDDEIFAATEAFLLSFCVTVANVILLRVFVAYIGTSILIDSVSAVGISSNITNSKRDKIIKLILHLLEKRSEHTDLDLMFKHRHIIDKFHDSGPCRHIIKNFECVVFMGLFSNNIETIRISRRLIEFYVFVITNSHHRPNCFDSSNLELAGNLIVDKMTFGVASIRKKIRDHLCRLKKPNDTLVNIWSLMYEKVALTYNYKDIPNINAPLEEINAFFKCHQIIEGIEIYSEYLASLGGILMSTDFDNDIRQQDLRNKLEIFITNKFMNLFSKDIKKREHAREILSVSIHPYLCPIIMKQVKVFLPRVEANFRLKEYNICELYMSVLRSICSVETELLFSLAVDLWKVNFQLLKLFNVDNNEIEFLRIKMKFCKLQVLFLEKLEGLSLNGNISKKNEYARIAASYVESSFENEAENKQQSKVLSFEKEKTSSRYKDLKDSEYKELQLDIRVQASIMLKLVLYKLPLDTMRSTFDSPEEDKSAASVIFSNYFNLFVRSLEKLNESKNDGDLFASMHHRFLTVNKEIIQGLINLLNANPEVGLKYSLPLGYHDDELIRISFIDVFSKIIKDVHSTYEREISKYTLFKEGCKLFINDIDFFLAAAFCCPKSDIEPYASSLLQLKISEKKKLELFLALIKYDVSHTSDKNEILRSNTVGTRVTALYSYEHATNYLIAIFRPIFQHMIITNEFFEIEKIADQDEETIKKNLDLFIKYLNLIAEALSRSLSLMPIGIRLIAKTIYDSTIKILPDSKFSSINAYLFLRLINPTIVSPERLNIVEYPNILFKRSLILLARVIQSIVNEAPVRIPILESKPEKLSYSKKIFFSFMKEAVDFNYDEILNSMPEDNSEDSDDEQYMNKFSYFHQYYYTNWMNIREVYYNQSFSNNITKKQKEITIKVEDDILLKCGLPKKIQEYEIPDSIRNDKSPKGILLYDFLSRTTLTLENTSFLKVLITRDGYPLICINTLELPDDISNENYSFALLQILSKFWETPFCVLMDFTSFNNFSLYEKNRETFVSIVPSYYKANCRRVYYVNMSSTFYSQFKHLNFDYADGDGVVEPELVFLSTNDDNKTISKNKLIGYNNPVSHDSRVSFHDVTCYQETSKRFVPIKLNIGNQFLQVSFATPERIKLGKKIHVINLVDCYKINELSEIAPSSFTGVANELSMINMKTEKRLIFTSTKKIEIMRTLYFSKARLNVNSFSEDDYSALSNPQFVVGQLLITSFAGLLSNSDEIRKSSYALLSSLEQSMGLQTGKSIDSIDGVVFPYGDIDYVCDVSASIAKNHPNLTYSIIHGFFNALEKLDGENQNSMVLIISPWIKNIYNHVYLSDSIKGPDKTSDIIRKCVRTSRKACHFQMFSVFIWPQLSLEDELIEIIMDEIVTAAIDHEAEGNDWTRITQYWPLRSSIEICSVIIRRMKEKSYNMPLCESEIETHTRWIETTVLAKFLSHLIFDSLLFVDRYISDIFYLVSVFMDSGPVELRRCLLNLLTRTYHSCLANPSLTNEQHKFIKDQIEMLNGARFKIIFGLTRDSDEFRAPHKILGTELSNKAAGVTVLCGALTSFLEQGEEYALQMVKWNSCVSKIAFDENSQLQCRAILVLGALSKQGIANSLIFKFVDLLKLNTTKYVRATNDNTVLNVNLLISTLHGFGKAILGIYTDSIFHPLIFWVHIVILLSDNVAIFRYGIEFLRSTLLSIYTYTKNQNIKMVDYIFEYKTEVFLKTEEIYNFKFTKENFDAILVLLCFKGLESPFTYYETIRTIKELSRIRYEEHLRYPDDECNEYQCYFFFEFLVSNTNDELVQTIEACGLKDIEYISTANHCKIPQLVLDWFNKQTLNVYSVCLGATNYFIKQKLDELASTRVVSLYVELFRQNSNLVLKLFKQIDGVLKKFVATSGTPTLLEKVLDMIVDILRNPEYSTYQLTESDWSQKLEENNIKGVANFTFTANTLFSESGFASSSEDRQKLLVVFRDLVDEVIQIYKESLDND